MIQFQVHSLRTVHRKPDLCLRIFVNAMLLALSSNRAGQAPIAPMLNLHFITVHTSTSIEINAKDPHHFGRRSEKIFSHLTLVAVGLFKFYSHSKSKPITLIHEHGLFSAFYLFFSPIWSTTQGVLYQGSRKTRINDKFMVWTSINGTKSKTNSEILSN